MTHGFDPYEDVLNELEEARAGLERAPTEIPGREEAQRQRTLRLRDAGGVVFAGHLLTIKSEAFFDDISAAAEKPDLDQVGQVHRRSATQDERRPGSE